MNKEYSHYESFSRHMPKIDDLALVTLKGHLLAEEILDDIILAKFQEPNALRAVKFSFFQKIKIAQAFIGSDLPRHPMLLDNVWSILEALNELRNDLAHNLESKNLSGRIHKFLKTTNFFCYEDKSEFNSTKLLKLSISLVLGYLSKIEEEVRSVTSRPGNDE